MEVKNIRHIRHQCRTRMNKKGGLTMSKVEIDKEDFLNFLNQIQKIAERALFNEGFDPHDWGEVENLVEEMTLKLKGLL